jgi:hypothetical protein
LTLPGINITITAKHPGQSDFILYPVFCGGAMLRSGNGINPQALEWLLEPQDAAVRYLARRDLTSCGLEELMFLQEKAHASGPIVRILDNMQPEGYWVQPGAGYYPKYTGTVWSVILLSQLGGSLDIDKRIAAACAYLISHALTAHGQFTVNGKPSGTADCLQGNLCAALTDLGCRNAFLDKAFEWMARSITGDGVAPATEKDASLRYYAGKCGPNFACGANNKLPCAWGAIKTMLAFSKLPKNKRTPLIEKAIRIGIDFLLSVDPAEANYPCGYADKPSSNWVKFGFPVFYVTDILQNLEALTALGYAEDPRLARALQFVRWKQTPEGRWKMEYEYNGKTWVNFSPKNTPDKWVTLRAMRVLKSCG